MATRELRVVRIEGREVVKTIDVTGRGEIEIERIMAGMLINMGDGYLIEDSAWSEVESHDGR